MVEELAGRGQGGIRTLFATHYHELTDLEGQLPGVRNFNIAVKEWRGEIVFLRRLVPGPADRSYGIEVSRLAGVPQPVVNRAKAILDRLEDQGRSLRKPLEVETGQRQSLLPGLLAGSEQTGDPVQRGPDPGPHPLEERLQGLDVDGLTPVQALNLLAQWKEEWTDTTGKA